MERTRALVLLHITVLIWGFTGILGGLIQQPTADLVFWRTTIALFGLGAYAWWRKVPLGYDRDAGIYLLTSLLIAAHWLTFYGAIKIGSVSIAAACLSCSTVFTALLEPLWFKRSVRKYELVLGVVVVAALILIFGLEADQRMAIGLSVLSALLSAWFNVVNGVLVLRGNAVRIGFYEMLGTTLAIVPLFLFLQRGPPALWRMPQSDVLWLLALGLVCTSFAFVAGIAVMRVLTPFTVVLAVNLEPVYTIALALLIWGDKERLHAGSYAGVALIVLCLFLNAWWQRRQRAMAPS
jgi:drug/metabolite transporter (DMT)-like permease